MEELYEKITAAMTELAESMTQNVCKGNKTAGVRARRQSLALEKLFKQYRKESIEAAKK